MTAFNLYEVGTRVYIKPLGSLGQVIEAKFSKKAEYVVALINDRDPWGSKNIWIPGECVNCVSADLRNAEGGCCFACTKWLSRSSFVGGSQVLDGEFTENVCFLCTTLSRREPYGGW
jgi:hypothetical protein